MRGLLRAALCCVILVGAACASAQEAGEPPLPFFSPSAFAAAAPDKPRPQQPAGRTLPLEATRHLRFTTSAGTWMSLDRSPDGKRIVFDLLGDLYTVAASGGRATRIAGDPPFKTQATYAPDGRTIAYVSDRSGAENLWVSRPDGSHARQITFGDDDTVLTSPA